jgi:hypothetical protein
MSDALYPEWPGRSIEPCEYNRELINSALTGVMVVSKLENLMKVQRLGQHSFNNAIEVPKQKTNRL